MVVEERKRSFVRGGHLGLDKRWRRCLLGELSTEEAFVATIAVWWRCTRKKARIAFLVVVSFVLLVASLLFVSSRPECNHTAFLSVWSK